MKNWLRLLTVLITSVLSLAGAELVLRTFRPSKKPAYMLDERYLFKPVPNAGKTFHRLKVDGGGKVFIKFNSLGFRGEEPSNLPGRKRIVVYGDSFIEANGSELENTFAKRLEKQLDAEVINAGVVGYGPDQISLRMDDELKTLKPDLVIVAVFTGNDYGDLLRNKIYRLDNNGRIYAAPRVFSKVIHDQFRAMPSRIELYQKTKNLLDRIKGKDESDESSILDEALTPAQYQAYCLQEARRQYDDYGSNEITNLLLDYYDADISLSPKSESARLKVQLMDRTVTRIKEIAEAHQTPLVFLIIPSVVDCCNDYEVKIDSSMYVEYSPNRLTGIIEDIAEKQRIPFVSLFEPFKSSQARLFMHYPDEHWNDEGQKLAAQLVADFIRANDAFSQTKALTSESPPATLDVTSRAQAGRHKLKQKGR